MITALAVRLVSNTETSSIHVHTHNSIYSFTSSLLYYELNVGLVRPLCELGNVFLAHGRVPPDFGVVLLQTHQPLRATHIRIKEAGHQAHTPQEPRVGHPQLEPCYRGKRNNKKGEGKMDV